MHPFSTYGTYGNEKRNNFFYILHTVETKKSFVLYFRIFWKIVLLGKTWRRFVVNLRTRRSRKQICNQRVETRTKRRATEHDSLLWGQKNWNSVRCGIKYFVLGRQEQPRQNKNLLYWHDSPNELAKEGLILLVFFESPFTSVSTVSRGYPSIVSLFATIAMTLGTPGIHLLQQDNGRTLKEAPEIRNPSVVPAGLSN